ncbi:unnamed protein product [Caenorhabditis auriculariae]|uniref:Uncharacterized protein n=1 Tax=Caenorhabditis auriculariae TaxID=2777116 RepID=A0A8S1H5H0_9PELO|nr:unnamed protein product [Caenorhabditis auriculariae]
MNLSSRWEKLAYENEEEKLRLLETNEGPFFQTENPSNESKMSFEHRSVVRLFSNSSTSSVNSRKTSVPSAVIASAPLMSAAVGDGLGRQLCTFF